MKLVGANRDQIGFEIVDGTKRKLAEPLHRIGMKENPTFPTDPAELSHRLNGAGLVVRRHDTDQHGIGPEGSSEVGRVHLARSVHGQDGDFEALPSPRGP